MVTDMLATVTTGLVFPPWSPSFRIAPALVEVERRTVPLLGGISNGRKQRGKPGARFATWLYPLRIALGDPDLAYRLVDCGGWHAYVPETFTIRSHA